MAGRSRETLASSIWGVVISVMGFDPFEVHLWVEGLKISGRLPAVWTPAGSHAGKPNLSAALYSRPCLSSRENDDRLDGSRFICRGPLYSTPDQPAPSRANRLALPRPLKNVAGVSVSKIAVTFGDGFREPAE